MITVLNITGLLPLKDIVRKKNENDILFITEKKLKEKYKDISIHYLLILPDTNKLLALISKKWKSYYKVKKSGSYLIRRRPVFVLGMIQLPRSLSFRSMLYEISFQRNKKKIRKIIEETNPTIIHAQNSNADAYLARRIKDDFHIPYVVTLRELNRIADSTVALNLKNANKLIALSPTQLKAAKKLTDKPIELIPHGIPEVFFVDKIPEKNHEELKLISVCRLLKLKNLDLVIEALSNYEGEFIYDIYGDGPEMENLQISITKFKLNKRIRLKGFIVHEKLPDILQDYNLFVMPSFPETLGRVYFEAMACGLPVLASKNTGIDGLIRDKKEGFLVEPEDLDSLRQILHHLLKNKECLSIMSSYARTLAENYKWDRITSELYKIYSA